MPGPAPRSEPGAPCRLRHRSGGGPARPGGGARGGQHHGQLPRRSAQPQGLGAVLTPTGPERNRRCAAAVPLHRGRPQARSLSNCFPPRTQKERWAPAAVRSWTASGLVYPLVPRWFKSRRGRRAWSPCKKERGRLWRGERGGRKPDPPLCSGFSSRLSNFHLKARKGLTLHGHSKLSCKVNKCPPELS